MLAIEVENLAEVTRDIEKLAHDIGDANSKSLTETGFLVQSEAIERCPIGPTKAQARTDPDYNYDRKKSPGELRRGIIMRKGRDYVDVGVMQGGAMRYANKIHNKRGTEWRKLGPASKAVDGNPRVGEKFVDRAYDENKDEVRQIFDKNVSVKVQRFNNGN